MLLRCLSPQLQPILVCQEYQRGRFAIPNHSPTKEAVRPPLHFNELQKLSQRTIQDTKKIMQDQGLYYTSQGCAPLEACMARQEFRRHPWQSRCQY